MSKSFKIVNGDFAVGAGRSFETVSGASKLAQDLRLWVTERIGTDPSFPTYGSRLDGGVVDGREIESYIGQIGTQERLNEIRAEVNTLLSLYQSTQLEKMRRESILYNGKTTLPPEEVLHVVENIEARQVGTVVIVRVTYQTLAGRNNRMTFPMEA
jgi:hypothetical protein